MSEQYRQLSHDEIVMGFVASCVEDVADKLKLPYLEVFERMEKVGLVDNYIYQHYDELHTESRENLTDSLIEALSLWENKA